MEPPTGPMEEALSDVSGLSFRGFTPKISRVAGDPLLKILRYSSEPILEVIDGKLVVSSSACAATIDPTEGESGAYSTKSSWTALAALATLSNHGWMSSSLLMTAGYLAFGNHLVSAEEEDACEQVIEVEIAGPTKSVGAVYMEEMLQWPDYDDAEDSMHWRPTEDWSSRVVAAREFRETSSGHIYNYRSKTLMGMASSRILNEPPTTTPKEDVIFTLPEGVSRPATDEELMMMSVLEMQALLRQGDLTSVELTTIALDLLDKYDDSFNLNEVDTRDLALRVAGEADALFAAGDYRSFIQGIPFAIKVGDFKARKCRSTFSPPCLTRCFVSSINP
jgi:hypothetical protein